MTEQEIEKILNTDLDVLYLEIGKVLFAERKYAEAPSEADIIQKAKNWLLLKRGVIQSKVCDNQTVQNVLLSNRIDRRLILVCAIADIIGTLVLPVPPFVVSTLIVKEGIFILCPELEEEE